MTFGDAQLGSLVTFNIDDATRFANTLASTATQHSCFLTRRARIRARHRCAIDCVRALLVDDDPTRNERVTIGRAFCDHSARARCC